MDSFNIPEPSNEPIPDALLKIFDAAGADWKKKVDEKPGLPGLCSTADINKRQQQRQQRRAAASRGAEQPVTADRRFAKEYGALVGKLADRLVPGGTGSARRFVLEQTELPAVRVTTAPPALLVWRAMSKKITPVKRRKIERTEACSIMSSHLEPLLSEADYKKWLGELARLQLPRDPSEPPSPIVLPKVVPLAVLQREAERAQDLFGQWLTLPPHPPFAFFAPPAVQWLLSKGYQRALADYMKSELLRRAIEPDSDATQEQSAPGTLIVSDPKPSGLGGDAKPARLFISEVSATAAPYIALLEPVLHEAASDLGIDWSLIAVAYGAVALALVPIHCIYDGYHGTCAIETLLPGLKQSAEALEQFARSDLEPSFNDFKNKRLELEHNNDIRQDLELKFLRVLQAFRLFMIDIADRFKGSLLELAKTAAQQSGGRVRTPVQFTSRGEWIFDLEQRQADGSKQPVRLTAEELIAYDRAGGKSLREASPEIFWILYDIWEPVGTAAALINQAGMRFFFNAANNRWGGNHPPHVSHRQGCSVDFDTGLGWKTPGADDYKVQNVKKQDKFGIPFTDEQFPGNRSLPPCLHGMERLAGWVGVQSFLLVGVTQYLYGDPALVDEAGAHLKQHFQIEHPTVTDGILDAGHNDHWHFEVALDKQLRREQARAGPYVWAVKDPNLFNRLHELAIERDQNPAFWQKFTGGWVKGDKPKVPTEENDFNELPIGRDKTEWANEINDWKRWWKRRDTKAGISLLPVWSEKLAGSTRGPRECRLYESLQKFLLEG